MLGDLAWHLVQRRERTEALEGLEQHEEGDPQRGALGYGVRPLDLLGCRGEGSVQFSVGEGAFQPGVRSVMGAGQAIGLHGYSLAEGAL